MVKKSIKVSLSGEKFYEDLTIVKSCTGRAYDGKGGWDIPITKDNLIKLQGIPYLNNQINLLMEQIKLGEIETNIKSDELKSKYNFLYNHQAIGASFAIINKNFLIADEMGTGKTVTMMPVIDISLKEDKCILILAPSSILLQWQEEIKRFINKESIILNGKYNQYQRINTYNGNVNKIILCTYESFIRDVKLIKTDWKNWVIIADEASKFKNSKTKIYTELKWVRDKVHSFIALSGTPVENSLSNFFNIISIIHPEFMTQREFYNEYCIWEKDPSGYGSKISGYKNLDKFLHRVSTIMIRRKKCDIAELPNKIIQNRIVTLTGGQQKLIEGIKKFAKDNYGNDNAIQALMLLREASNATSLLYESTSPIVSKMKIGKYIPEYINPQSNKLNELNIILDEINDTQKVIIFTQFKRIANIITNIYKDKNIIMLCGDNTQEERNKGIDDFKNGKYQIMVATDIFGYGVNLQFADILINFDIPWNPAKLNQRIDRIHRIGATSGKVIINLISEDVEQWVKAILDSKQDLFDQVVDGKSISDESIRSEILRKFM